jgi:hypothetical protein
MHYLTKQGAWTGAGEFKETSVTDGMMLNPIFDAMGMAPSGAERAYSDRRFSNLGPDLPPLEKLDPTERTAERHRQQMAALESIPKYEGPPADPKTAAEIERILSEIRSGKKSNPNDSNA